METGLTAPERISAAALARTEGTCLVFGDDALTHGQVDALVTTVAGALAARGFGHGRRVAVLSPNHLLTLVATVGILRSGATWIPLNPRDSMEVIADLCDRFRVELLIHHSDLAATAAEIGSRARAVTMTIPLDPGGSGSGPDLLSWAGSVPRVALPSPPAPADLAVVFATGGTTGIPKGVCYSHRTLSAIVGDYVALLDHAEPVFLAAGPLTHVSGRVSLGVMAAGGTTVVLPQFASRRRARRPSSATA